jgi:hypothetical protein
VGPPASRRVPRVRRYSGFHLRRFRPFRYRAITCSGRAFQSRSRKPTSARVDGPTTPPGPEGPNGLGSSLFARRYSGSHGCFLFLRLLRCFNSPGWLPRPITPAFRRGASDTDDAASAATGCPIRKPRDLSLFDGSPGHIAVYSVLHRLLAPRHPPYTLGSMTLKLLEDSASSWLFATDASPIHMSKSEDLGALTRQAAGPSFPCEGAPGAGPKL